jgi:hypothetical protein
MSLDDEKWSMRAVPWPSGGGRRETPAHTLPDPISPSQTRRAVQDQTLLDHAHEIGALKAEVAHVKGRLEDMDGKLDQIIAAANMGRGAWLVAVKAGGIIATIAAGAAWIWQHVQAIFQR